MATFSVKLHVQSQITRRIVQVEQTIKSAVNDLFAFVKELESSCLDPRNAGCEVPQAMQQLAATVMDRTKKLEEYSMFDPDLVKRLEEIEISIEDAADRFFSWTQRKHMTVTEACAFFGRSRSTIYRWIKSGKVLGRKEANGRWTIISA